MWGELALGFQKGNPYVLGIFIFACFACVIIFERFVMLQFVYNINFAKFITNFKKAVGAEDLDRALNICKASGRTSLPLIASRAIEAAQTDPTTVRGTIEEESIAFMPRLEARISVIPALSTIIMLLGVLGTIDAMWSVFSAIDVLDSTKKQATLAQGIAGALNPTAFGLLVCMFLMAAHQFVRGMAMRLTDRIHHGIAVLHNLLVPAETAVVSVAAADHGASAPAPVARAEVAPSAPAQGKADDSFDDAQVEDIKDEEEII